MLDKLIYILLGAIIWQGICLIVLWADDDEQSALYAAIGVWFIPALIIGGLHRSIKNLIRNKRKK